MIDKEKPPPWIHGDPRAPGLYLSQESLDAIRQIVREEIPIALLATFRMDEEGLVIVTN